MNEAASNTLLNKYLREMRKQGFYCYYELKVTGGKTFLFSKIEKNQDEGLPALAKEGLVWKFSDEDSRKKPCDGASLPPLPSYLVIRFGPTFYFIHYEDIKEMMLMGKKSITLEEAKIISNRVVHISN